MPFIPSLRAPPVRSNCVARAGTGVNNRRIAIGEARAAAIIGMADAGLAVMEYAPTLVKQTVAGYGRGEKSQVAEMVRLQLALKVVATPAAAADALAITVTHWAHTRLAAEG